MVIVINLLTEFNVMTKRHVDISAKKMKFNLPQANLEK